ncbi:protein-L-isoaspartate(D-aspartate) O-methyltransferase [candidate division KSB1 bacterium]|nr:protein-L-isoaspartate(D-aspartate) O-methyltransferase [candidate division KSB1 bacterium]
MVQTQLAARGISNDRVLSVMKKVPRHLFVPQELIPHAYEDYPLPIGENQTISQPYIVALMTELLDLGGDEKVLEIGTGSGYQAAVLSELAGEVYSIEIIHTLAEQAKSTLDSLGYENVYVITGDGYAGLPGKAPFDCIIVTAAPRDVPKPLLDQLKNGGRMVIPVGEIEQDLLLIEKSADEVITQAVIPVRFVPMTGKAMER